MLEEHGDDENGDDRRQGDANGTHNASPDSLQLIADMTRHVDGEDARSGLSHYHDIHELLFVHPLVLVYKFLFHDRYHGVAST